MQASSSAGNRPAPRPATGRLGVLTPGLGAVATPFIAGVESIRRGLSKPIGSLTQMATIRLGKRTDKRSPFIKEFVPLARLDDLVFGGWDPIPDDALTAARKAATAAMVGWRKKRKDIGPPKSWLAARSSAIATSAPGSRPASEMAPTSSARPSSSSSGKCPGVVPAVMIIE